MSNELTVTDQHKQHILRDLKLIQSQVAQDTLSYDLNWGKNLIVDDNNINEVKNAIALCIKGKKLTEAKVEEAIKAVRTIKRELLDKTAIIRKLENGIDSYTNANIYNIYDQRKANLEQKIKDWSIQKEQTRRKALEEEKQKIFLEEQAKRKEIEEVAQKVLDKGVDPELVKQEETRRLNLLEEQKLLDIQTAEASNRRLPSLNTTAGKLQERFSYKLDVDNVDKAKIIKFLLDNLEHLDLIEIDKVYANKVFKPTGVNPNPITVDGLPFTQDVSFNVK